MRQALDRLYLWSGYLSAIFLVGIALTIIAQVVARFFPKLIVVDSTESAGFCLAASTFLGLAYTFRHGAHIRVTLVTRLATGLADRLVHLWSLAVFIAIMGLMTYWSFDLVYFSFKFNDISPGLLAIPFWIPRSAMAIGSLILLIALIDEIVCVTLGKTPSYVENDMPAYEAHDDTPAVLDRERG